jgi:hypothetical protein
MTTVSRATKSSARRSGPRGNGIIVEFYVSASDGVNTRTWPAPALNNAAQGDPFVPEQSQNCLYQVDDVNYAGAMPIYRLITKAADRTNLADINNNPGSHAKFNATFISVDGSSTELRYLCDARNRGHFSSGRQPQSFHVGIPNDHDWKGRTGLNFNTQFTYLQLLGSAAMRRAGLVSPESRQVQVRLNGVDLTQVVGGSNNGAANNYGSSYGFYVCNEVQDSDFAAHHFPLDDGGNIYSVRRTDTGRTRRAFSTIGSRPGCTAAIPIARPISRRPTSRKTIGVTSSPSRRRSRRAVHDDDGIADVGRGLCQCHQCEGGRGAVDALAGRGRDHGQPGGRISPAATGTIFISTLGLQTRAQS